MSVPYITRDTVFQVLREAVKATPDAVNPRAESRPPEGSFCIYTKRPDDQSNAAPRCVAGEVLHRLGLPVPTFAIQKSIESVVLDDLNDPAQYPFDQGAIDLLQTAQSAADSALEGQGWAVALRNVI